MRLRNMKKTDTTTIDQLLKKIGPRFRKLQLHKGTVWKAQAIGNLHLNEHNKDEKEKDVKALGYTAHEALINLIEKL